MEGWLASAILPAWWARPQRVPAAQARVEVRREQAALLPLLLAAEVQQARAPAARTPSLQRGRAAAEAQARPASAVTRALPVSAVARAVVRAAAEAELQSRLGAA
jgi:hypothetical protein